MIPKFRVWDKKDKRYVYDIYLQFYGGYGFLWRPLPSEPTLKTEKEADLEMWSTFLDKNKVEIYEGDLITNRSRNYGKPHHTIIFDNGCFVAEYRGLKYYLYKELHDIEVVGNIHEVAK